MSRDVALFNPNNGWVRAEFMNSALNAITDPAGVIAEMREMACGPVMGQARCAIVSEFLALPFDWLLMIDSDMTFTPATLRKMRESADPVNAPIVGAQCWTVSAHGKYPTMYHADTTAQGQFGFTSWHPDRIPADELVEVDATGAACLLLHRSVFKRLSEFAADNDQLWFGEMAADNRLFGEDFSFCIRCKAAGIPIHVATGAKTGHVKSVIVRGKE